jgi:hypothetical protein
MQFGTKEITNEFTNEMWIIKLRRMRWVRYAAGTEGKNI